MGSDQVRSSGVRVVSHCEAVGEKVGKTASRCSRYQRAVWKTRRVFQAKPDGVGSVLTRRAGFCPFPVDPQGEHSSFCNAKSSRKSITLSMPEHGPRWRSRHADYWPMVHLASHTTFSIGDFPLVEATLNPGRWL